MNRNRKIIHLDMDAFYASIEERDNPELRGKPLVVGAQPGMRGVVSTCNYEARKYGIRSAMSSTEAYRRCPEAIFVPPHFGKYKEASDKVHAIMAEYTDKLEFVSLDEGYMDVTGSELIFGKAEDIALTIQKRVFEAVGTTCSVGVGYSMMSAKCASEEKKPRGFYVIHSPEEFAELMRDRPVRELYGIGEKTAEKLTLMGIKTVGQLADVPIERLHTFGSMGEDIKRHAIGLDYREVVPNAPPKSIGRETTFLKDITDNELLCDTLLLLSGDVSYRLHAKGYWGRTVTLKVKFGDMKSITRSHSGKHVRSSDEIYKIAAKLLEKEKLTTPVRLIGVSVSNLTDTAFMQLSFDSDVQGEIKSSALDDTIFKIKTEFGRGILKTAKEIAAEEHLADTYENE